MDYSTLPWNFEAFRKFITFRAAQNASNVISLFDGQSLTSDTKALREFQTMLSERSGLIWEPIRQNSEDVVFNNEGNVFRNKARVLSSLFLINPFTLKNEGVLEATTFSKRLSSGKINEKQFFEFIFTNYEYPHPAYDENWTEWNAVNLRLKPFIFILQILIELFELEKGQEFLTVDEFARFAHRNPFHSKVKVISQEIRSSRNIESALPNRIRSDKVDRKINDIFGFLCISGICYFDGSKIRLNLITKHPDEETFFYLSRNGVNVIENLNKIIERGITNDRS
jgi:hypothetical protein